jgi:UDP-N-acetylmuramate dehydrogenase
MRAEGPVVHQTDAQALDALADALGPRARRDAPLGARTTYRVGGPAALLVEADDEDDLAHVHDALARVGASVPVLVLGEGSNLLVADAGFPGLVVSPGRGFAWDRIDGPVVRAGGRTKLPVLARRTATAGLRGLEWAVGVPGTVGGALRMNAGGHGSDSAAVLSRWARFDLRSGRAEEAGPETLALGYRRSALGAAEVVTWAEFRLTVGERAAAEAEVAEVVRWRRANQPGGANAGSVFVNPPGESAGRLVEESGLKGHRLGSAHVSAKHANFIQADAGGSADDVWHLVAHVRAVVRERTGVNLVPEVRAVGFADEPSTEPEPSTNPNPRPGPNPRPQREGEGHD